jgi:hypothetical protein
MLQFAAITKKFEVFRPTQVFKKLSFITTSMRAKTCDKYGLIHHTKHS